MYVSFTQCLTGVLSQKPKSANLYFQFYACNKLFHNTCWSLIIQKKNGLCVCITSLLHLYVYSCALKRAPCSCWHITEHIVAGKRNDDMSVFELRRLK